MSGRRWGISGWASEHPVVGPPGRARPALRRGRSLQAAQVRRSRERRVLRRAPARRVERARHTRDGGRGPADRPGRHEMDAGNDPAGRSGARAGKPGARLAVRTVFACADRCQPAGVERRDGAGGGVRGLRPVRPQHAGLTAPLMPGYFAAATFWGLRGMVLMRVLLLRRAGTQAMHFGKLDKTDFLTPPFALFYFYTVFAAAFDWPLASTQTFFRSDAAAWLGVGLCVAGLALLALSLASFGRSFRVGIDVDHPDRLVTTGIFGFSRKPIYVGFACVLLGEVLVFPNCSLLAYLVAGFWLFHRQVLREEAFLHRHYGGEYAAYCARVRRYL